MVRNVSKKTAPKKKRAVSKKRKMTSLGSKITIGRVAYLLGLFLLLVFSVGMLGYVVFFRTVVAAELPFEERDILFEEPYPSEHDQVFLPSSVKARDNLPGVVVIIDDMGFHYETGKELIGLDLNLSFSFLPYAPFTAELEEKAYQQGKTILLHLPMEPRSSAWDPGPDALYLKDSEAVHERLFEKNLRLVPHATGVNSHMGSKFSADPTAMDGLAAMLKKKQLFFIDSFTTPSSKGLEAARKRGVLSAKRHIFLDNVQKLAPICKQLEKLVELAKHQEVRLGLATRIPKHSVP